MGKAKTTHVTVKKNQISTKKTSGGVKRGC